MNHFASEPIIYIWVYITWIPVGGVEFLLVGLIILLFYWLFHENRHVYARLKKLETLTRCCAAASNQHPVKVFCLPRRLHIDTSNPEVLFIVPDIDQLDIRPHTRPRSNIGLQLGKRRRRWPNCKTTLFRSLVFAGHLWETPHDNVVILKWRCLCPAHDHLHFSCSHIPIGDTWYLTLATDNTFFVQVFCFCQTGSPRNQ